MADIKFTNFARATLAIGAASGATSLTLASGKGALFPALTAGQYFYLTLENAALTREIVKVTDRVTDVLTVVRAQDGTTAAAWNAGDVAALRWNAATITDTLATAVQKTSDTGAAAMPSGTTAQRPSTPTTGWTRANTTTGAMEWWNGSTWASMGGSDYLNTTRIDVASATTLDLTTNAPNTRNINITGTTSITGVTVAIGQLYFVRFNAALTLTNNANIVTQTGSNITTAAGDTCMLRATAANTVEVLSYVVAAGYAPANGSITPAKLSQPFTSGTAIATTSGTSIDFTGIPSWAKRITILLNGISTNGTSFQQIQIGAGSMDVTGYNSNSFSDLATANSTTGFLAQTNIANAGYSISGRIELSLFSSATNTWLMSGVVSYTGTGAAAATSGNKTLSGTLDRLRLTTINGTDTFDAGSINIQYE